MEDYELVPFKSFGPFEFGASIKNYLKEYEFEKEADCEEKNITNWEAQL